MRIERRCVPRKRPGGISYFEFAEGTGGIVLDASEKGLAFQAADAVERLGPSRIFISPHPEQRIELNGDVVWTDRSKKTGGLRFADLGPDSCNRIRDWLRQPGESGVSRQGQEYPSPAWGAHEQRPVEPRAVPILPPLLHPDLAWQSRDSEVRRGFLNHMATGFLIAAFGLACLALVENLGFVGSLRPRVADTLILLGEKLNGTTDSRSRNSAPQPDLARVPPPPPPRAVTSIPAASHPETLPSSDQGKSSAQSDSETPRLAAPAAKKDGYHFAYSRSPQERSLEVSRLWSAVGAGSSAAEVDLARLYLKGEGVPRNCEQARILLRAAAKSGSREAREQLRTLGIYGCR